MNNDHYKSDKVRLRHTAIRELIRTYPVENQALLVTLLRDKYGIDTTQSIVSRDLQELGVGKQKYQDTMIYELKDVDVSKEILRLGVRDVTRNESLVVVKTFAGMAAFVGDYLDLTNDSAILATVAGENVVFVAPALGQDIHHVYATVCKLLHFKQKEIHDEQ